MYRLFTSFIKFDDHLIKHTKTIFGCHLKKSMHFEITHNVMNVIFTSLEKI